jgi:hypothetical protein
VRDRAERRVARVTRHVNAAQNESCPFWSGLGAAAAPLAGEHLGHHPCKSAERTALRGANILRSEERSTDDRENTTRRRHFHRGIRAGDIGDVLFRVACNMDLEGIVSKRLDHAYCAGRCKHWVKVKNPAHPAYSRVRDAHIGAR